ncbi:hypothetical protein [Agrilutibacter solisilvae]|uniref:Uncharacterized protein n=1 Tax=Agrilutibacter solisilvae TaxID=2763317 RepID=A0A974XYW2_9GAMM|nr:hypothetical protein [Lysobacter solisilvae]QSX77480.1 hypothetical protein I8J32_012035 [Lysobacter solisilvae]
MSFTLSIQPGPARKNFNAIRYGDVSVTSLFRHLEVVGIRVDLAVDQESSGVGSLAEELLDSASNLASLSTLLFAGLYPKESVYFWWGESISLPWYIGDEELANRRSDEQLRRIHGVLTSNLSAEEMKFGPRTYLFSTLCRSAEMTTRSLAVEALLCVDEYVECIVRGDLAMCATWLAAAYSNYLEAVANARDVMTSAAASRAAGVRHKTNRELLEKAKALYFERRQDYRTISDAAEDIAETVGVSFDTARRWVGRFRRLGYIQR